MLLFEEIYKVLLGNKVASKKLNIQHKDDGIFIHLLKNNENCLGRHIRNSSTANCSLQWWSFISPNRIPLANSVATHYKNCSSKCPCRRNGIFRDSWIVRKTPICISLNVYFGLKYILPTHSFFMAIHCYVWHRLGAQKNATQNCSRNDYFHLKMEFMKIQTASIRAIQCDVFDLCRCRSTIHQVFCVANKFAWTFPKPWKLPSNFVVPS